MENLSEERQTRLLRAVAANTPVILWAMDPDGFITLSAGRGLDRLGIKDGDHVGLNVVDLYPDYAGARESYERALAGETFRAEFTVAGVVLETWFQPRHAGDGTLVEILAVSWDITEALQTREAQRQVAEQQREVAEQQRSMLLQMLAVQEAERHELAGRMHDDLIQVLAAVDLRVQLLTKKLDGRGESELSGEVDALHESMHSAIERLRGVLFALEPPRLGDGLAGAMRDLAAGILQGTGVAYEVVAPLDETIGESAARVLYRIAAEALANVARHARADFVAVTLTAESAGWALMVVDDGVGPGPEGFLEKPGHRGLSGMRDRVTSAGGTLTLHTEPTGGTQLRAWVPNQVGALLADLPPLDLREPLREILDEADEAFIALDLDWRYVFVNRRAAELAGRQARELEGEHIWTEFPSSVGSNFYVQCHRSMTEQRPVEFADFAGGRWLENRLLPTKQGLFAFYRDVTEQRRSWQRADHSGDAGALLLAAVSTASAAAPEQRVGRILQAIVDSRWFTGARVIGPDGEMFAEATAPAGTALRQGGLTVAGSQLLSEPLIGIDGRVEFEGQVPVHLAVRWLARVVAALVTPAVRERG
jgi:PAS domain S-box-containing protein